MAEYGKPKRKHGVMPSDDERILAAVSHGSFIFGFGIIVPLIIWLLQREQSAYVRFQALQAALWQLLLVAIGGAIGVCAFPFVCASGALADAGNGGPVFCFPCSTCGIGTLTLLAMALSLYATVKTFLGHDFRYPLLGNWLRRNYR
jgi:uncharacterized Tic20 family protein